LTYRAVRLASVYFNYSEASRTPTSIELGCADPNQPCDLPNALVGDPPLKQVVTRTVEAGLRGTAEGGLRWSAGWFFGQNYNDILFVSSPQTGFGYFTNFGKTRRDGIETSVSRQFGKLTVGGNYTFLNATYRSEETIDGSSNPENDGGPGFEGNITVEPGNFIPEIPRNIFKAYAEYQPTKRLSFEADFDAIGRSYARGNENNLYQPDGMYYLGQGYSPGYGVLNVSANVQLQKHVQAFVKIDNVLNHHYYTAAQEGPTPFDNNGNFVARPFPQVDGDYPIRHATFFAPGAPIGAWGGLRFTF
jgi:outer membrane receptor protein involved in Fe transport